MASESYALINQPSLESSKHFKSALGSSCESESFKSFDSQEEEKKEKPKEIKDK